MARREEVRIPAPGGHAMPASLALPDAPGPHRGVLVIHEAFGLNDDIRRIAGRFADAGYAALAPDLFSRGAKLACVMRAFRELRAGTGQCFADGDAAREWLVARDDVDASRVGVAGFCFGGGFALLYAVKAPVGATAPFYGEVPKTAAALDGVCPVVASFGARDRMFGQAKAALLEGHLTELGVPYDVKVYPAAGHSFMSRHPPGVMSTIGRVSPMHADFNEDASEDAWRRVLTFFARHLQG